MAKYMKASDLRVQVKFKGKRPEFRIVFTDKAARQLYIRLRNRFEK